MRQVVARYTVELVAITVGYFLLAKLGLMLASLHPSASPIWPPTGFALAVVLLRGYRVWPAILAGALIANATTAGSVYTAAAIATGNALEALIGAALINRWSDGRDTFATPVGVAKFALICLAVAHAGERDHRRRHSVHCRICRLGQLPGDLGHLVAGRSRRRAGASRR